MKYTITVPIYDETTIETTISCRWDAKFETLASKIIHAVHPLVKDMIPVIKYRYTKPNIYTNGCFPQMWIECNNCNPIVDIFVKREDGKGVFY